jgi:hypothetical protein
LIAANEANKEEAWLRRLLNSVGIVQKHPTLTLCSNRSTVKLMKNPVDYKRTKHVDIEFLHIKEMIEVKINYINTRDQV